MAYPDVGAVSSGRGPVETTTTIGRFVALPAAELRAALSKATFQGAVFLNQRIYIRAKELCPKGVANEFSTPHIPLAETIVHKEFQNGGDGTWRLLIGSESPVMRYVIDGTVAHEIVPKQENGVLRFKAGGQVVFTRRVQHPGTKSNPFLQRAQMEIVRSL